MASWGASLDGLTYEEDTDDRIVLVAFETEIFLKRPQTSCGNIVTVEIVQDI
jgi:hypothetical protein